MRTTGNRALTLLSAIAALSTLADVAASQETQAKISFLKSSPDGRSSIMSFSISGLDAVKVPKEGCLRFILETGGGEYWAQETERLLRKESKSASIKNISTTLDKKFSIYIAAGDRSLCDEMDSSRKSEREINQDVAHPIDYKVSNTCIFYDLNDLSNIKRENRCRD